MPAIGAKECIYNLCFAFLDPGDVALAADPGYPVYTAGPALAGAEAVLMPLRPELGFVPDLERDPGRGAGAAPGCCSSTTPTTPPARSSPRASSSAWSSWPREHEILVVHDNSYSETTYDGYVAPSFLATPGRQARWGSRSSRSPRAST